MEFQRLILSADGDPDLKSRASLSMLQRNEACAEVCSPGCWSACHHTHAQHEADKNPPGNVRQRGTHEQGTVTRPERLTQTPLLNIEREFSARAFTGTFEGLC